MTGLDTNVLVRYIVRDDPAQTRRADTLIQSLTPNEPGFMSMISLAELAWVLHSYYRMPKGELIKCINRLLNAGNLVLESDSVVRAASLRFSAANCEFADCLTERSGHFAGCADTVTFDAKAARAAGMRRL